MIDNLIKLTVVSGVAGGGAGVAVSFVVTAFAAPYSGNPGKDFFQNLMYGGITGASFAATTVGTLGMGALASKALIQRAVQIAKKQPTQTKDTISKQKPNSFFNKKNKLPINDPTPEYQNKNYLK